MQPDHITEILFPKPIYIRTQTHFVKRGHIQVITHQIGVNKTEPVLDQAGIVIHLADEFPIYERKKIYHTILS